MESVFQITTLGERRRLAGALRRLANRQGFGTPGALAWDAERVCRWLAEEGLAKLQGAFRSQVPARQLLFIVNCHGCLFVV